MKYMSQSLHFFRAFQALKTALKRVAERHSRNPFTFSGHFKLFVGRQKMHLFCRNPFTFSGHFKDSSIVLYPVDIIVAIPSLFQGISSLLESDRQVSREASQSLHFFRAFQVIPAWKVKRSFDVSQSLHFFRAFQEGRLTATFKRTIKGVAIPSLFQGISSRREKCQMQNQVSQSLHFFRAFQVSSTTVKAKNNFPVAIPSLFQGISRLHSGSLENRDYVAIPSLFQGISRSLKKQS